MKLSDVTALGRVPIDPRCPTNLAIGALALTVMVTVTVFQLIIGAAPVESTARGVRAGLALFLTWALGRELDPDHDLSAFVGAGLIVASLWLVEEPSLSLILWLMVILRTVNRTVGLPAKPLDSLAVLGFGAWLAWQGHWVAGLMTTLAFLLDGLLPAPLRYHLLAAGLTLGITVAQSVMRGHVAKEGGLAMLFVVPAAVTAGLFLIVIATSGKARAVGDATGQPLDPRRVQAAQGLALTTALLLAWSDGETGILSILPLWAAMLGVSLYRLANLAMQRSGRLDQEG